MALYHKKTVTISPVGGDYRTIQDALDANTTEYTLFIVYPGDYSGDTIAYTANNQSVIGMDNATTQVVTVADANIVDFGTYTNCVLNRITVRITAATSDIATVTGTTGSIYISESIIEMTNASMAGAQPSCIDIMGAGICECEFGYLNYTNTVACGANVKSLISLASGSSALLTRAYVDITTSGVSAGSTLAYGTGTGTITVIRSRISITDANTTEVVAIYMTGAGIEISNNNIYVTGGTANRASAIWKTGAGTITSKSNIIECVAAGGGTAVAFIIGSGATLVSTFDVISAANGVSNSGTYTRVNSPTAGNLQASGNVGIGVTTTPTARLQIAAGTATASTAPIKLTAGTVLGTPEAGTIEFDGTDYFMTV